jgi:hypothetical protein
LRLLSNEVPKLAPLRTVGHILWRCLNSSQDVDHKRQKATKIREKSIFLIDTIGLEGYKSGP